MSLGLRFFRAKFAMSVVRSILALGRSVVPPGFAAGASLLPSLTAHVGPRAYIFQLYIHNLNLPVKRLDFMHLYFM